MGSPIEINDTLKISKERGFPRELSLDDHVRDCVTSFEHVRGRLFPFWNAGERLYHRPPTRVFLVEEIDGRWLYWGHALVREQTIRDGKTEGQFEIVKLYDPEYQRVATAQEAPAGRSYFGSV